jgi:hypothetical protein
MTVLLRNTTTNSVTVPFVRNNSMDIFVLNQNREPLSATNRALWLTYSGPSSIAVPARRQITYLYRLNEIFDLRTPGKYYIYARGAKFRGPWERLGVIQSGIAEITVAALPNSAPNQEKKTQ